MTKIIPRKKPTWIGRARRQLNLYLQEGTSEISAFPSDVFNNNNNPNEKSSSSSFSLKNPYDVYFDETRDRVAVEAPYPVIPSLALQPGHAYATSRRCRHSKNNGQPILVYRDKKDPTIVRAFVNSCRHRGSPLLREETNNNNNIIFETTPLKAPLLTCPYHAWTYDAKSGKLKKIPGHKKAFGLLDKEEFGLETLTCFEQAGIVWIGGDHMLSSSSSSSSNSPSQTNQSNHFGWSIDELSSELEPFLYDPSSSSSSSSSSTPTDNDAYKVFGFREWKIQANWQLAVETALESYHIKSLHNQTLNAVAHPTWGMSSHYVDKNLHAIMTIPLRSFQQEQQPDNDDDDNEHNEEEDIKAFLEQTTTTCLISPSTLVTLVKRCFIVNTIEPIDNTSCRIRSWALPHRFSSSSSGGSTTETQGGEEEHDDHLAKRDYDSIITGVEEDWDCVEQIQRGLTSGYNNNAFSEQQKNGKKKNSNFVFGGYEGNNIWFLQNVGEAAEWMKGF